MAHACSAVVIMAAMAFTPPLVDADQTADAESDARSFLTNAAEKEQIEQSLGQLAAQRASNDRVKNFGSQMADDHKQTSFQIEELALKAGVRLSPGVSQERKEKIIELSQLSGHAFDREYINFILQDHEKTVQEFTQRAKTIPYSDIRQWIASTLAILEAHREKARLIKYALQTNPGAANP